jgi:hypothetical protein
MVYEEFICAHLAYLVDRKGDDRDAAAPRRPRPEDSLAGGRDARQLGVLHIWRLPVLHEVFERGQCRSADSVRLVGDERLEHSRGRARSECVGPAVGSFFG